MSADKTFFDTSVLLYLLSAETSKADCAERLLAAGGVVSVQVLSEFTSVGRRKLDMSWDEIAETVRTIRELCRVEPLTEDTYDAAVQLASQHALSWYDAMIVAAAQLAKCSVLYTEDMRSGLALDQLKLVNPFRRLG